MIGADVPLNEGLLRHIEIKIPKDSCLNPSYPDAVVSGNVEVSQLLVDSILAAASWQANSQGTMNNISFGNDRFQYYETLGGGSGAGHQFDGESAKQTHMTNSRLTDVEVLETRLPLEIVDFSIRKQSGGEGRYRGGWNP